MQAVLLHDGVTGCLKSHSRVSLISSMRRDEERRVEERQKK